MSVIGIVCEYNPFHKGHEYQIQQAKQITGADHVICFMSGNFLQRGVPALADKYTRALIALRCSVDAVFEIPFVYSTSSARDYAYAAVSMMNSLNCIDYISFGAETASIDILSLIADIVTTEPKEISVSIKALAASGMSYGAARAQAISEYLHCRPDSSLNISQSELDSVLSSPNNILAIEYLAALNKTRSHIKPVPIPRVCAGYNSTTADNDICSATAIRKMLLGGDIHRLERHVPEQCYSILSKAYGISFPVFDNDMSVYLSYSRMTNPDIARCADMDTDLSNRLSRLDVNMSFSDTATALKCRNYTLTHIQRGLLHVITKLTNDDLNAFKAGGWIYYINMLGLRTASSKLIGQIKTASDIPVITKNREIRSSVSAAGQKMFRYDELASDLYRNMIYQAHGHSIAPDHKHSVILV